MFERKVTALDWRLNKPEEMDLTVIVDVIMFNLAPFWLKRLIYL